MDEQEYSTEPVAELHVTELETLRIMSDGLRARMVDLLRAEPLTARELAAKLDMSPKQLYYHLALLERHGLIRVVRTRVVSGIIEKQYRATAYLFMFDNAVFASEQASGAAGLPPGIGMLFDSTRNQLALSYEQGEVGGDGAPDERRLLSAWALLRLAPAQAAELHCRLRALLDEYEALEDEPADGQDYRLFLTLFPVRRPRKTEGSE